MVSAFDVKETDLIEECTHSSTLVEGEFLTLKSDEVRLSNGQKSVREYVLHPGAVVVVPMLSNGDVILEKQFRYPLHQVFIEFPAGKIDLGEDVLLAGQRELQEETGYVAKHWAKLGLQHPCIGYSNEVIHMYLATDLIAGPHARDEGEILEVFELSLAECLAMTHRGEITDSKTIVALFLTQQYLQENPIKYNE